jgi:hypothetical protein
MSIEEEKAAEDASENFDPNVDPALLSQSVDKLEGEEEEDGTHDHEAPEDL